MSTIKYRAKLLWTECARGIPQFKTESGRYFTYVTWMKLSPSICDVPVYLIVATNKAVDTRYRFEIYSVPIIEATVQNNQWKRFSSGRDLLVEIEFDKHNSPKLVRRMIL